MRKLTNLFSLFILILALAACQQTTNENEDLEIEQFVAEQAAFGYQINDMAATSAEIEMLTSEPLDFDEDIPGTYSVEQLKERSVVLEKAYESYISRQPALQKTAGDTAFIISDTNGVRTAFAYSAQTGKGYYSVVVYEFPSYSNMVYDSSALVIDMNFTFLIPTDDVIEGFYNEQQFKSTFFISSIVSEVTATEYSGTEIVGISADVTTLYQSGRDLEKKEMSIDLNADGTGSAREDFYFSDGTTRYAQYTIESDYSGSFEKKRRDGTLVSGTFNQLEDDNHGSYTSLVDFAEGFYLDKIMKAAEVWIDVTNNLVHATYAEQIYFSSGRVDSTNSSVTVTEVDSGTVTEMTVTKFNGAHGTITIFEGDELSTLAATWTTWDNYYIIANAEYYIDGSAMLHYEVYLNEDAYNNGEDALIVADYYFSSSQTGDGNLTYDGSEYQVEFDDSGKAKLIKDGQQTEIELYY